MLQQFIIHFLMRDHIMLLEATLIQVALTATIKDTFEIASSITLLMNLQMLFQITTGCKFLVAVVTHEGSLPSVNPLVSDQVAYLTECLLTTRVLALVGLLLIVDTCMLLQRGVLGECLITLKAIQTILCEKMETC